MKYQFTALIRPNEDGTRFYARVPDLTDVCAVGRSFDDAAQQVNDVAGLWVVSAELEKKKIPSATPAQQLAHLADEEEAVVFVDSTEIRKGIKSLVEETQDDRSELDNLESV